MPPEGDSVIRRWKLNYVTGMRACEVGEQTENEGLQGNGAVKTRVAGRSSLRSEQRTSLG